MTTIQASEIIADPFVSVYSGAELAPREHEYYFGSLLTKNVSGIVFMSLKEKDSDNYEFFYRNLKAWVKKIALIFIFCELVTTYRKKVIFELG